MPARGVVGGRGVGQSVAVVAEEAGPDGLEAGAVGDAPGFGEGGDELEAPAVLGGVGPVGPLVAHRPGGMVVGDLQHEGGRLGTGRVLQPEEQLDGRTGVHDRVGDQFAGHGQCVVGQPLAELTCGGQAEPRPFGERGPDESAGRGRGLRDAGQARAGGRARIAALTCDDNAGTLDDVPLRGNGPHGAAPDGFAKRR